MEPKEIDEEALKEAIVIAEDLTDDISMGRAPRWLRWLVYVAVTVAAYMILR